MNQLPSVLDSVEVNSEVLKNDLVHKNSIFNQLNKFFLTNPYFSAGAGLIGIGAIATISKRALIIANTFFRRQFVSVLEVDNTDRYK